MFGGINVLGVVSMRTVAKGRKRAPLESAEQAALVRWLRRHRVAAFAVPNGGLRPGRGGVSMRAQGVERGIPDLLIIDRPPFALHFVGVALELKRQGGRDSDVRPEQRDWLERFDALGWAAGVAFGADAAIVWLRELGFGGGACEGGADGGSDESL